ncbi:MAG: SpoIID/LytB domain-containing protein [Acutalibacteraceae bacterium]
MMKLLILRDISAFSSDTVYKLCLTLESRGLSEESIERYDSYEDILESIVPLLEQGEHVIVAPESGDYNAVKRDLISKLILESDYSPSVSQIITDNAGDELSEIDVDAHSLMPLGATPLLSKDGLYCGFTMPLLGGRLTYLPLDFMRVDAIVEELESRVLAREESMLQAGFDGEIRMPDYDLVTPVSEMVQALSVAEKTLALATSEATMWVYNLYDQIENLTSTVKFVEIVDTDPADESTAETESARVIRCAREAMFNLDTDYGAAVSDIYSTQNQQGDTVYFAYAAMVDRITAKAKKINISDPENLPVVLPHAVSLMADMVCEKLRANSSALTLAENENEGPAPAKAEEKKLTPKMIALIAAVLAVALITPIILVFTILKEDPTTQPTYNGISTGQSVNTTASTSADPFGSTSYTGANNAGTEPSAEDVSATQTSAPAPSTSGIFTFYVFGYGHGVGMSQTGANYLANQGWTFSEILAHYYYDSSTSIVTGDLYPQKITYAGAEYDTKEYLARALASEMGDSFHQEALKAQCIAIYNFAKHYSYNLSADAHAFDKTSPSEKIYSVVNDVMDHGYYIATAGGEPALTPFHAMSAGVTTSYYNVWGRSTGTNVPYLSGGRKSYGDYLDDEFKSVYSITSADLKKLVEENKDLGVTLSGDPSTWLTILSHDKAVRDDIGYVSTISVGGKTITGNDFRIKVMGGRIRSHCFALTYTPDTQ